MSDKIEPTLSAEEWQQVRWPVFREEWAKAGAGPFPSNVGAIAALNDMLPDSDPRKITRAMVEEIRDAARLQQLATNRALGPGEDTKATKLRRIADALESHLPPVE